VAAIAVFRGAADISAAVSVRLPSGGIMTTRRVLASIIVLGVALGLGALEATTTRKKAKSTRTTASAGMAGAVSGARNASRPTAIDDDDGQGFYCALSTPNVHHLGTLPPNFGVTIDFESTDTSDPIAILTTIKMDGTDIGAENVGSDDEGGLLNPRFELRRPYWATYILTVGSADEDEACYAYRMRIRE
jgi:hypothetical protein